MQFISKCITVQMLRQKLIRPWFFNMLSVRTPNKIHLFRHAETKHLQIFVLKCTFPIHCHNITLTSLSKLPIPLEPGLWEIKMLYFLKRLAFSTKMIIIVFTITSYIQQRDIYSTCNTFTKVLQIQDFKGNDIIPMFAIGKLKERVPW